MIIMTSYISNIQIYIYPNTAIDFHENSDDSDDNFDLPEETTVQGVVFDGRHARVSEMETNL